MYEGQRTHISIYQLSLSDAASGFLDPSSQFSNHTGKRRMDSFNEELANILDVERVNGSDQLRSFENWDSLSILSICAMIDTKFGVSLNAADLQSMNTVEDLATFVTSRASR